MGTNPTTNSETNMKTKRAPRLEIQWAPLYRAMMKAAAESTTGCAEGFRAHIRDLARATDSFWCDDYEYEIMNCHSEDDLIDAVWGQIEAYQECIKSYMCNKWNFEPGASLPEKVEFNPVTEEAVKEIINRTQKSYIVIG